MMEAAGGSPGEPPALRDRVDGVFAVVVTFDPDMQRLAAALDALAPQVAGMFVVDNASQDTETLERHLARLDVPSWFVAGDTNVGLAAAQNVGVQGALAQGARKVLLLDQDTILVPGCVRALDEALDGLLRSGTRVAVVGPAYVDASDGRIADVWKSRGLRLERSVPPEGGNDGGIGDVVACDFVIASGSLIPAEALAAIGPMDADLFIDLVDVEWCLRARARGYASYQARRVVVNHRIGDGRLRVGWFSVMSHGPIRNYYWVRNAIGLLRRDYVPAAWRIYFLSRIVSFAVVYPLFGDQRMLRLRMIGRGIRDGLAGPHGAR